MRVLICGGGVIGASIAYFLSRRGVETIVIEKAGVACAASGKSGGFLALDWCDGTPLEALARRSFALHASLAEGVGGEWGYRRLDTYAGQASARTIPIRRGYDVPWLSDGVVLNRRLGSTETTAQVHPGAFTSGLMRLAEAHGAKLRAGTVTGVVRGAEDGKAEGVLVDGETLEGDAVVIAMGPWSMIASEWLPLPPVFGLKGHSIVLETGSKVSAEALFLDYRESGGAMLSPEVFPRGDGTTYVCGLSGEGPVPSDPADVTPDPGAIERLREMCSRLSPEFAEAKVRAAQACFRPVTRDGLPLIGRVPTVPAAYVATGHSVWGILNAPATGEAMAELIVEGASRSVDLSPFDPARLPSTR